VISSGRDRKKSTAASIGNVQRGRAEMVEGRGRVRVLEGRKLTFTALRKKNLRDLNQD